jgi:poly-beta-1,6-N-acetyl-D-glucosamine synthase
VCLLANSQHSGLCLSGAWDYFWNAGLVKKIRQMTYRYEPEVAIVIAAYNEADVLGDKIENTLGLQYPREKLKIHIVTDGSSDASVELAAEYKQIQHYHQPKRQGKLAAIQRIMPKIDSPIVVLTDANCMLNSSSIRSLVQHYQHAVVGAVAGEKKIIASDTKAGIGEGLYWRYESWLKKVDSDLCSTVGAAGELFSFRRELFEQLPGDTIIEDFVLSMRIAMRGYKVKYEPDAIALETASASIADEWKRKVRICAGGFQSLEYLPEIWNPFRFGLLSVLFLSHRFLRWAVVPFLLPLMILVTALLAPSSGFYAAMLVIELTAIAIGIIGLLWHSKRSLSKIISILGYILMMNAAAYAGLLRYLKGSQSVVWEKAKRQSNTLSSQ